MTPQIVYKVVIDVPILFLTELITCTAMALVRVVGLSLSRLRFSERVKPSCNIDTPSLFLLGQERELDAPIEQAAVVTMPGTKLIPSSESSVSGETLGIMKSRTSTGYISNSTPSSETFG